MSMKRFASKLTYANVTATIALFLALGGASYAATQLPKNSVGAKQLKKGAVTPAKLSKASTAVLAGPQGPQGPKGEAGTIGATGKEGPQGPGAVTFEGTATASNTTVRTVNGVEIQVWCIGGEGIITLDTSPE